VAAARVKANETRPALRDAAEKLLSQLLARVGDAGVAALLKSHQSLVVVVLVPGDLASEDHRAADLQHAVKVDDDDVAGLIQELRDQEGATKPCTFRRGPLFSVLQQACPQVIAPVFAELVRAQAMPSFSASDAIFVLSQQDPASAASAGAWHAASLPFPILDVFLEMLALSREGPSRSSSRCAKILTRHLMGKLLRETEGDLSHARSLSVGTPPSKLVWLQSLLSVLFASNGTKVEERFTEGWHRDVRQVCLSSPESAETLLCRLAQLSVVNVSKKDTSRRTLLSLLLTKRSRYHVQHLPGKKAIDLSMTESSQHEGEHEAAPLSFRELAETIIALTSSPRDSTSIEGALHLFLAVAVPPPGDKELDKTTRKLLSTAVGDFGTFCCKGEPRLWCTFLKSIFRPPSSPPGLDILNSQLVSGVDGFLCAAIDALARECSGALDMFILSLPQDEPALADVALNRMFSAV
jgi:hypothetical protein